MDCGWTRHFGADRPTSPLHSPQHSTSPLTIEGDSLNTISRIAQFCPDPWSTSTARKAKYYCAMSGSGSAFDCSGWMFVVWMTGGGIRVEFEESGVQLRQLTWYNHGIDLSARLGHQLNYYYGVLAIIIKLPGLLLLQGFILSWHDFRGP